MKKCSKCEIEKEYNSFGKRKASKDGLSYICKECKSKIDKEYSESNKEYKSEYLRKYYLSNREKIVNRTKNYYSNNKSEINDKRKDYYLENKEVIIEKSKNYYHDNKSEVLVKQKIDYYKNTEKYRKRTKDWYIKNKDKAKEYKKTYYKNNIDKIKEYRRNYYQMNRDYINEYMRDYWSNKKYIKCWRSILYRYTKYFSKAKIGNTISELKYTPEMLRMRMECQFKPGMSWENYGDWQIDHKKPLSKFNINDKACLVNALSNLQPLWKIDNIKKSNKWK